MTLRVILLVVRGVVMERGIVVTVDGKVIVTESYPLAEWLVNAAVAQGKTAELTPFCYFGDAAHYAQVVIQHRENREWQAFMSEVSGVRNGECQCAGCTADAQDQPDGTNPYVIGDGSYCGPCEIDACKHR